LQLLIPRIYRKRLTEIDEIPIHINALIVTTAIVGIPPRVKRIYHQHRRIIRKRYEAIGNHLHPVNLYRSPGKTFDTVGTTDDDQHSFGIQITNPPGLTQ
jgi:hypothetical protein